MRFGFLDLLAYFAKQPEPQDVVDFDPYEILLKEAGVVHDYRGQRREKRRGRSKGKRPIGQVTGICLHQTAVVIKSPERFKNVPAHSAVLQTGAAILMHDPTAYLWHGNGLNAHSVGIEVDARAAGIEGNTKTLWKPERPAHEASNDQLESARALVRYYCKICPNLTYIWAHRQSHSSRVSDPGSRIWWEVGEYAVRELGLKRGPVVGSGRPLPDAWTGQDNGVRYNWRVRGNRHPSPIVDDITEPLEMP